MEQILLQTSEPHPLEQIPTNEAELIEKVAEMQVAIMKNAQDPRKRGQHPKQQAVLRGTFEIADDVPAAMRAGIFARSGKFDALIRMSTGPKPNDNDLNPHALAVKLINVPDSPSGTQDFIALDQPTFFIRNIEDYVTFFEGMLKENGQPTGFWRTHPREFALNLSFFVVINSHLERQFWGEVPVAMGDQAMRFTWMPSVDNASGRGPAEGQDGLRDALAAHFIEEGRPAEFSFGAQCFVDQETTPIEDATSVWPTPFNAIGKLKIPAQNFVDDDRYALGERLSFTPWHCHQDHRPLGGIQRCRRRVYIESTRLRHSLTGASPSEPTRAEIDKVFPIETRIEEV